MAPRASSGWDLERLHRGMEADWFDPADVHSCGMRRKPHLRVLNDGRIPLTKWHTEETPEFGEVYVIGLSEAYRGQKLRSIAPRRPSPHDGKGS